MTSILEPTDQAHLFVGGAGTGKTACLIEQTLKLIGEGVPSHDILIFCATPSARDAFAVRLQEQTDQLPRITTVRDWVLETLSTEEAIRFTGRDPHILSNFEINFLLEDLKTSGLRPRRLKEMLKFFYRGWTELADDDKDWLIAIEETEVYGLLKDNLASMRALFEPEMSNLAVNFFRSNKDLLEKFQCKHVIVDDYHLISRASQVIANMMAQESLTVAGNKYECLEVYESYPYAEGLTELVEANENLITTPLTTCYAPAALTKINNNLLSADSASLMTTPSQGAESQNAFKVTETKNPSEEAAALIAAIQAKLADENTDPSDIFVVAPNRSWENMIATTLAQQGLSVDHIQSEQILGGDIRDNEKSRALRIYTALKLSAYPENATAWRCWCGFGDYLTNSSAFSNLRSFAEDENIGLVDALEKATKSMQTSFSGAEKIVSSYNAGRALLAEIEGKTGADLLTTIAQLVTGDKDAPVPATLLTLCGSIDDKDDALTMYTQVEQNLLSPRFTGSKTTLKIGSPKSLCGLTPQHLLFCGFMNGFIPHADYFDGTKTSIEKQEKMWANDTKLLYSTLGKAHDSLTITYCTQIDLESASRLQLKVERIRLEKGQRVCLLSPSDFLKVIKGESE